MSFHARKKGLASHPSHPLLLMCELRTDGGKKGMLTMSDIHCIRFLRNQKGQSIDQIAKSLKINWRTVKKYADDDLQPSSIIKPKKGMMYTEK